MSNALGIAAVTAVLRDLLQNGLIDHDVSGTLGDVDVFTRPPDLVPESTSETGSKLNLYMYQVMPNPGWQNVGLPSRDVRGERVDNPPLALDLSYLLTAYGSRDLFGEILLGYAMQVMHENPFLSRQAIRDALAAPSPVNGSVVLPASFPPLSAAALADQVEQIKVTPLYMDTEEMSRVWTALQAKYRPTSAYKVSVVLIESEKSARSPLPVKRYFVQGQLFTQVVVDRVESALGPGRPILAGQNVHVFGTSLRGDDTRIRFGDVMVQPTAVNVGAERIRVRLPDGLRAGIQGLQVVHFLPLGSPPRAHAGTESNMVPFILQPSVRRTGGAYRIRVEDRLVSNDRVTARIQADLSPNVKAGQRIVLKLNAFSTQPNPPAHAYSFPGTLVPPAADPEADESGTVEFAVSGVVANLSYLARVQVDGAESPLDSPDASAAYNAPRVNL